MLWMRLVTPILFFFLSLVVIITGSVLVGLAMIVLEALFVIPWLVETKGRTPILKWIDKLNRDPGEEDPEHPFEIRSGVPLPDAYELIREILIASHKGTNFWNVRYDNPKKGIIIAALQFQERSWHAFRSTAEIQIILTANLRADDEGIAWVKIDYEVSTKYGGEKTAEKVMRETTEKIREEFGHKMHEYIQARTREDTRRRLDEALAAVQQEKHSKAAGDGEGESSL